MIPLDKLKLLKRAYVHKNCPDGVASALILKDALPELEVHFVKYDTEEHKDIAIGPNTIFCDFSPWLPKSTAEFGGPGGATNNSDYLIKKWNDAGVVVLDHHAKDIVEPYTYGVFGENDKLECGAWLAFEHVWLPLHPEYDGTSRRTRVEDFARLAAIRDTWKKDDPDWNAACEQAAELMFWKFEQNSVLYATAASSIGFRLLEKQIELAHTCIKEAFSFTTERGTRVLMFQGVSATSDAAEKLGDETDLVVGFHYRMDGGELKLQFSTRSHTGYDCQALAQANGGNGHKAAAGFTVSAEEWERNPYDTFRSLLYHYEASR